MTDSDDYEGLFREGLPTFEKVIVAVAARFGLRGDDAEDFASEARIRLWENDYAVLRQWQRKSSLRTYVTVVFINLAHELRQKHQGRCRPPAVAERLGRFAIQLYKLVYCNGMRLDEAIQTIRTRARGERDVPSERELADLYARLPVRPTTRELREAEPIDEGVAGGARSDDRLLDAEALEASRQLHRKLKAAIAQLPSLERTIVRMYFLDGISLADVARALGIPQKPLYRVKDHALRTLRTLLEAAGVDDAQLLELLGGALLLPAESEREDEDGDDPPPPVTPVTGPVTGGGGAGVPPGKSGEPRPSNESWESKQMDETRPASRVLPFPKREA